MTIHGIDGEDSLTKPKLICSGLIALFCVLIAIAVSKRRLNCTQGGSRSCGSGGDSSSVSGRSCGASRSPPVQYCVSIGPSCHAAEFLRSHPESLRRFALPFDWIHSDPALIQTCVGDGCKLLLDRKCLVSAVYTDSQKKLCLHRQLRTIAHAHIFNHHDPAVCDVDFIHMHRASDRLRRILEDTQNRTLFLHLEINSCRGPELRSRFIANALAMFDCIRGHTSNFALVAIRVVAQPIGSVREEHKLIDSRNGGDDLLVLELTSLTKTVIPFSRLPENQATHEEQADFDFVAAAISARFDFALRSQPPPDTLSTVAARAECGPKWVWSRQNVLSTTTITDLQDAMRCLPGGEHDIYEKFGQEVVAGDIHVLSWAEQWVEKAGAAFKVRDWRAAAKRLAVPSRRSPTHAALVSTVISYQLADLRSCNEEEI